MIIDYWTYLFYTFFALLTILGANTLLTYSKDTNNQISFNYSKPGIHLFIVAYTLIIGLRYMVGRDYYGYFNWFKELKATGVFPVDNEVGFIFLNKLIVYLDFHYSFLFIVIAFLQIFFLVKSIEKFPFLRPWFFFFFFSCLLFFISMNAMRQTIAFFIFFYSLNNFLQKKYLLTFFLFLLALSFHKSIIMLYVLLPFVNKDWFKNVKLQVLILIASVFIFPLFIDRLLELVNPIINLLGYNYCIENLDYMAELSQESTKRDGLSIYMFFFIDLIIILYSDKLKLFFSKYNFQVYYNLFFIGLILSRLFANNFILARIAEYFIHFRILILSFLCFYLIYSKQAKFYRLNKAIVWLIAISMAAFFYKAIYNNAADCSPFQFVFEQ